ncbi:MAG TPA: hypothetical protein VJ103_02355 [Candidatus Paceibacterota bacterium]|nr:hypothetical protein [Candidatus Paceibacterota bacterium]
MKNLIFVISFLLAQIAWAEQGNGSFFQNDNITQEELLSALNGESELYTEGVTPEIHAQAFASLWNGSYLAGGRKLDFDEEGIATIKDRLQKANTLTLPANTKITEAYWKNGNIKRRDRLSLADEKFLVSPNKGKVLASLRCGNPVYCAKTFGDEPEPVAALAPEVPIVPAPPIAQKPETVYVDRPVATQQPVQQQQVLQPQILQVYWPVPTYPASYYVPASYPSCGYSSYYGSPGISFGIRIGTNNYGGYGYGYNNGYSRNNNYYQQPTCNPPSPKPATCQPANMTYQYHRR